MDINKELGWDDAIEQDNPEYVTLQNGDYDFEIIKFERARHAGSEKLPPCNKAIVFVKLTGDNGDETVVKHNLFLHTKTEGMLCEFFTAIGQRKKGERLTMNWNAVPGSRGRCKVAYREWVNEHGDKIPVNDIKKFYEPQEGAPKFQAGNF